MIMFIRGQNEQQSVSYTLCWW